MGHKSGQCKTPGCNKEQWKDGYCRNCAQYSIQKETISGLTTATQLLLQVAHGLKRVEENISALRPLIENNKFRNPSIAGNFVERQPSSIPNIHKSASSDETFIPTIESKSAETQIKGTKTLVDNKNITQLAEKLSRTNIGG